MILMETKMTSERIPAAYTQNNFPRIIILRMQFSKISTGCPVILFLLNIKRGKFAVSISSRSLSGEKLTFIPVVSNMPKLADE